jgi:hypothetical protein
MQESDHGCEALGIALPPRVFLSAGWYETVYVQRAVDALPAAAIRYGAAGAQQWVTLMANNDISAVHRDCQTVTGGGEACSYNLWSRLPQVPTR